MPRDPYPKPRHADNGATITWPPKPIIFCHPGYNFDEGPMFLTLPACDNGRTLDGELARLACAVLACNRFDGFLSVDRDGKNPVTRTLGEEIKLDQGRYYFQVPAPDDSGQDLDTKYPICPHFRHWVLPDCLPDFWQGYEIPQSSLDRRGNRGSSTNVLYRDDGCRLTQHLEFSEIAHVIPSSETEWYNRYLFGDYSHIPQANAISFRSDVHKSWDAKHFTIVPRPSTVAGEKTLVAYVLHPGCPAEVVELYHDVQLQPICGTTMRHLFARFAWTLFPPNKAFCVTGPGKLLRVRAEDGTYMDKFSTPDEARQYVTPRSRSPRKRSQSQMSTQMVNDTMEEGEWDLSMPGTPSSMNSEELGDCHNEEEGRGRKRLRRCEEEEFESTWLDATAGALGKHMLDA